MERIFLILIVISALIFGLFIVLSIIKHKKSFSAGMIVSASFILVFTLGYFFIGATAEKPVNKSPAEFVAQTKYTEQKYKNSTRSTRKSSDKAQAKSVSNSEVKIKKSSGSSAKTAAAKANHNVVYITKSGKKYHYSLDCSSGTYYECTVKEAIERGLSPCKKCVK